VNIKWNAVQQPASILAMLSGSCSKPSGQRPGGGRTSLHIEAPFSICSVMCRMSSVLVCGSAESASIARQPGTASTSRQLCPAMAHYGSWLNLKWLGNLIGEFKTRMFVNMCAFRLSVRRILETGIGEALISAKHWQRKRRIIICDIDPLHLSYTNWTIRKASQFKHHFQTIVETICNGQPMPTKF
jgi:hypothetical protein